MRKLIVILLLLFAVPVFGADVQVTQSGSGAPISVSEFNALSGDKGGNVYYFSGPISTKVDVDDIYGTGTGASDVLTLDGYEGGSCDPINDDCANGALLTGGMELNEGRDYITIQDFRMTEENLTVRDDPGGTDHSYITIQHNYFYDMDDRLLTVYEGTYITITDNKFDSYGKVSNTSGGIYLKYLHDTIFRGNEVGHTGSSQCSSCNNIEVHQCDHMLFEYNEIFGLPDDNPGAGIAIKENGSQDIIVRFNSFHNNGNSSIGHGLGINWPTTADIYIYGNLFYDNPMAGLYLYDGTHHVYIWSNIFIGNGKYGFITQYSSGRGHTSHVDHVWFYNNTLARNNSDEYTENGRGGIVHNDADSYVYIKNNILWNNRPAGAGGKYTQIFTDEDGSAEVTEMDYNTVYHDDVSPGGDLFHYENSYKTLAEMVSDTSFCDNGKEEDSGFTDPNGADNIHGTKDDDYTLNGTNSIDDGADLSGCFEVDIQGTQYEICYDDVLNPATVDWTGDAKDFADNAGNFTTKQDDNGDGWERGAYASPTSGLTITVTATDATATEESTTTGEWTIACSPNCAGETINFSYSGTADIDDDYDTDDETGDIVITGANDTITLTPVDDDVQDIGEVAILTITSGTGYKLGSPISASITIEDNDGAQDQGVSGISGSGSGCFTYTPDGSGSGSWTR